MGCVCAYVILSGDLLCRSCRWGVFVRMSSCPATCFASLVGGVCLCVCHPVR